MRRILYKGLTLRTQTHTHTHTHTHAHTRASACTRALSTVFLVIATADSSSTYAPLTLAQVKRALYK